MNSPRKFVEDLLRRRRPSRFDAAEQDEAELRTAILLTTAQPGGDDKPSEGFVSALHDRLAAELDGKPKPNNRRRFVQTTGVAAAAAVIGATVDQVVRRPPAETRAEETTIVPDIGQWRAVVPAANLPEGVVRPFDFGTVSGFVQRVNGQLQAVSGTCTHLGCKLALDAPAARLNCPCHKTAFSVDGAVVFHKLPTTPPPLPHLKVRDNEGMVEVFAPPQQT
ncbi:ubiquinol-cytochrome c reductase iron-sulfur subunit [Actinocrispum wychmicini]|uniref:Secreted protein n=1 Tax=Actinocrispum wychmicini TaxID=1213861 RepID=A0A4R2JAP8_9PSEU|nr:Rieske (2Fe-2S) protein [Actinocrispum wychmicini]TCO53786.1 secreted protein [Actinocrispum wychmicini]